MQVSAKAQPINLNKLLAPIARGAALTGIKSYFAVGERLFPARAAKSALTMWLRMTPPPATASRDRGVAPGEPLSIEVNGRAINVLSWGAGPVVLCAHGWNAWWQHFSVYVQPLVDAGLRVVAWDAPSHGDSAPGEFGAGQSGMPDLRDAILAVAEAVGPDQVHGVIAHSGATLATMNAMVRGFRPERVVFVSTSVKGSDQISYFSQMLGWGPRTVERAFELIADEFQVDLAEWELDERLAGSELELPPLLMLHHAHDAQTPLAAARHLAEIWPDARLRVTEDYDHHRLLWAPWTVDQAVDFLQA